MKREQETFPYIAKLLNGAEVEWKPLGEVAKVNKGVQLNKTKLKDEGKYPAYNGGKTYSGWTDDFNVEENTTIISQGGASAGFVNFVTTKFWANAHCYYIIPNLEIVNNRYLYQFLKFQEKFFMNSQHGAGIPALATSKLNKHLIPIPPLSVQQEIVRILDKFTQLEAELEAELDCRKRQYEYYRDKLLTSDENQVEWKTLGEVLLSVKTGLNPRRFFKLNTSDAKNYYITIRELRDGKIIPSDKTDRINDDALNLCQKRSNLEIGDVLFSGTGTIGEMAIIKEEPYNWNIKEGVYALKPNHIIITSGYIRYILSSQKIKDKIISKSAGGTVKSISMKELQLIQIPVPPIEEQERIAGILDKFDTLVNSISEGLPREIELRRKQYEYYREKLLSFPKN